MKAIFPILFLLFGLSITACRTYLNRLDKRHQTRYFPIEYENIYLSIPLKEAQIVRPAMNLQNANDSLLLEYQEYVGRDKIGTTLYFFEKKEPQPLNKFIIEFTTVEEANKVARWLYGKTKEEKRQWQFDSKEGFMIDVEASGKKITIAKEK